MEKKYYNILWIDDEHEGMSGFKGDAKYNNIHLIAYKSLNDGISELKKNYPIYDGVLLDAKFFENEDDVKGSEDTDNVHRAKEELLLLPKKFEVFVFTGQAEAYEDKTFNKAFRRVYKKGDDDDVEQLFKDIKVVANSQIDTQIKHDNQRLFDVLNDYPDEVRNTFLSIFKGLKSMNTNFDDQLYFTQLRIILEHLFRKANAIGLLHDECVQKNGSQVNLTESSLFLSGKDTRHLHVTCSVTHFPKVIAENIKNIIHITGAASHTSQVDVTKNVDIQEYRKNIKTPYFLYSLAFQIMDTIIWFEDYSKANNDIELNKSKWKFIISNDQTNSRDWIYGEIIKIENGWITFQPDTGGEKLSIPPHLVVEGMTQGQVIKVKTEPSPDGTKTFVKEAVNS